MPHPDSEGACKGHHQLHETCLVYWPFFSESSSEKKMDFGKGSQGLFSRDSRDFSGKKKEHKPTLFGPVIFGWGGGLPCEGVGANPNFGMSFETQGNQTLWRDVLGCLLGYPGVSRKVG